jgi:hypothetical protein
MTSPSQPSLSPLFTQVRGRGFLRTSPVRRSPKFGQNLRHCYVGFIINSSTLALIWMRGSVHRGPDGPYTGGIEEKPDAGLQYPNAVAGTQRTEQTSHGVDREQAWYLVDRQQTSYSVDREQSTKSVNCERTSHFIDWQWDSLVRGGGPRWAA